MLLKCCKFLPNNQVKISIIPSKLRSTEALIKVFQYNGNKTPCYELCS